MKITLNHKFPFINCAVGALALLLSLSSCHLENDPVPAEEIYLRNFIKQFGLIDPNQDWNLAEKSDVTIRLGKPAEKVVVYANIAGEYYRVARSFNVKKGVVNIPFDIPVNTEGLAVQVDDDVYLVGVGEKVDATVPPKAPSRADEQTEITLYEEHPLGWVIVAEDLGSTDDVDFNDFVARFSYTENAYYMLSASLDEDPWDVIDQQTSGDSYIDESTLQAPRRTLSRAESEGKTTITIKALAAGGVKPIWLHYRASNEATDYIIGPLSSVATSSVGSGEDYEWHRWFDSVDGFMINTGTDLTETKRTSEITFDVDGEFTFSQYSGLKYANESNSTNFDPYSLNFDKRQIKGFYISVDSPNVNLASTTDEVAFDIGQVIGGNLNAGLPPQMFLVPDLCGSTDRKHYRWPTERTAMQSAYRNFSDWVKNGTTSWYTTDVVSSNVVADYVMRAVYGDTEYPAQQ